MSNKVTETSEQIYERGFQMVLDAAVRLQNDSTFTMENFDAVQREAGKLYKLGLETEKREIAARKNTIHLSDEELSRLQALIEMGLFRLEEQHKKIAGIGAPDVAAVYQEQIDQGNKLADLIVAQTDPEFR